MTLATRCSACGTSFRVVQDQLKVSGGWVRCGRCNEVFNALEALYEIDTQPGSLAVETARQAVHAAQQAQQGAAGAAASPQKASAAPARSAFSPRLPQAPSPPWSAPSPPAAQTRTSGERPSSVSPVPAASPPPPAPPSQPPAPSVRPMPTPETLPMSPPVSASPAPAKEAHEAPPAPHPEDDRAEWAAAPVATGGVPTEAAPLSPSPPLPPSEPVAFDDRPIRGFDDVETRLEPRSGEAMGDAPSFMRPPWQDSRAARPGVTRTARRLSVALALLLVLQLTLAWRDHVAARVPAVAGLLRALCVPLGCQVLAPRQLSALTVEGSQLRQRPGMANGYDLTVALRNRADTVTLLPAVELTLTDSQGQALIRRVLLAQDWRNGAAQLPASADITLQTVLVVADSRVAGYTVEIFYP